jgi:hypothetical protein
MSFQFPVGPRQALVFARGVRDIDPVREARPGSRGGTPLVAPPTFVRSAEHFDWAGALEFFETVTEFRDQSGELCAGVRKATVQISGRGGHG